MSLPADLECFRDIEEITKYNVKRISVLIIIGKVICSSRVSLKISRRNNGQTSSYKKYYILRAPSSR
jgi:hypothetical protein